MLSSGQVKVLAMMLFLDYFFCHCVGTSCVTVNKNSPFPHPTYSPCKVKQNKAERKEIQQGNDDEILKMPFLDKRVKEERWLDVAS